MSIPMTAAEVLDREFLEIRSKLLQLAASFDRLDRAPGSVADDPRSGLLARALRTLDSDAPNRAEHLQMLFSRQYDAHWRDTLGVSSAGP
ncbi:MAG: hypothetical protein ACREJB_03355 [Planctomycetaceae bacterium]